MSSQTQTELVRVFNRGNNTYQHGSYRLLPASHLDVPPAVADIWCAMVHFGDKPVVLGSSMPATVAAPSKPSEREEKLSTENKELQDRIANLEKLVKEAQHPGKKRKVSNPLD